MGNYHYYVENQDGLHSNPTSFEFHFKNESFKFHTDDGVFSKKYIDYGSFVMLSTFLPNTINAPILDMGAGYGAIGIVLSRLYDKPVLMAEINERAVGLIQKNIQENKVTAEALHSNLYSAIAEKEVFSSIVTNPPIRAGKQVVFAIYEGAYQHLLAGGELWVVIQKKQGAPSSKEYIEKLFGNCEIVKRDKGYYILRAVK